LPESQPATTLVVSLPLEGGDATNDAFFVRGVKLMEPDQ
jgi:hypothetical protein